MIDRPQQLLLALSLLVLLVWLLRSTSPRRRQRAASLLIRSGWVLLRLMIGLLLLLALVSALDATTYVDVNICIDLGPGVEWCHEETESAGGA